MLSTISSSAAPFSCYLQSFPASLSFPVSWLLRQVAKVLEVQLQHQSIQHFHHIPGNRVEQDLPGSFSPCVCDCNSAFSPPNCTCTHTRAHTHTHTHTHFHSRIFPFILFFFILHGLFSVTSWETSVPFASCHCSSFLEGIVAHTRQPLVYIWKRQLQY